MTAVKTDHRNSSVIMFHTRMGLKLALSLLAASYLVAILSPQNGYSFALAEATDSAPATPTVDASVSDSVTGTDTGSFSSSDIQKLEKAREKFEFQAEVSRLMDIIINSLYTKKDIFLRELISNGSDALDKIRFKSVADKAALGSQADLEMRISTNKAENSLTLRDTGIGMTKTDLINYLGTVARSGTASLMEQLASGGDLNLIGQFGVGFYSVYLVADKVRVVTKHKDDKQYIWESSADGTYTVAEDPRGDTLGRGTEITLFLKDDATEFTNQENVKNLIKRYSEFITFPIHLRTTKMEEVEVPVEADEDEAEATPKPAADDEEVAAEDESADDKPKTKKEMREVATWELVNSQKAIWSRGEKDVSDDEYKGFYRAIVKDGSEAHTWIHFKAEGEVEFRAILYVPTQPPPEMYDNYYGKSNALRLYVRKVLIADEFEDLLPRYLNFIRGVVDSDDLPLNVSREQLQQGKILKVMGKKLVRKVLEMIRKLAQAEDKAKEDAEKAAESEEKKEDAAAEDASADSEESGSKKKAFEIPSHLKETAKEAYSQFWEKFGKNIKLGIIEDTSNRSKLAKLTRWHTTKGGKTAWRSLDSYIADMPKDQKLIYYIAGESWEAVQDSPFLERFAAKNIEVVVMTDPIDEYAVQNLPEYEGHKLQSITKEGLVLPGEADGDSKKREDIYRESFKPLTEYLKKVFGEKVERVLVSSRLASAPAILVTSAYGYSANMERIMKSQAFADPSKSAFLTAKKTLEINPRHPIIISLKEKATSDPNAEDDDTKDMSKLLYDTALMNSGFSLEDPKDFSARIYRLLKNGLKIDSLDLAPEVDVPADEVEEEEEEEGEEVEDASAEAGKEEL